MELIRLLVSIILLCYNKKQGCSFSLHPPSHDRYADRIFVDPLPGESLHGLYAHPVVQTRYQRGLLQEPTMLESHVPVPVSQTEDKAQLAQKMKQRFLQFRRTLEEEREKSGDSRAKTTEKSFQVFDEVTFENVSLYDAPSPKLSVMTKLPQLEPLPLKVSSQKIFLAEDSKPKTNARPAAPKTFDPSIVLNLFKLAEITSKSKGEQDSASAHQRSHSPGSTKLIRNRPNVKTKVVKRKLQETPLSGLLSTTKTKFKDGKKELPMQGHLNQSPTKEQNMEPLSLYILRDKNDPSSEDSHGSQNSSSNTDYASYSQGNDPKAGIPASEVNVPDLDLSQLHLPEDVRHSLQNYLQPLLSLLQPLRKSVPGLPGLDYPILSVVPYTNFYCSKMPWPGYYADTEARCQTWHACDIDGRQSTFLCPNGTVFNQALMVCDWWYNTDCLSAPFLYSLNERLFGDIKPEPVAPYNRITLELLDTIFI